MIKVRRSQHEDDPEQSQSPKHLADCVQVGNWAVSGRIGRIIASFL